LDIWKSWGEISSVSVNRDIVFYGRSEDWIPKSLQKVKPSIIVDNNNKYHGQNYLDIPIGLPSKKLYENDGEKPYVIITSGVYDGIIHELINNGYIPGTDFSCCPEYRDYKILEEIREYEQDVYISCSDYNEPTNTRYSKAGGGIYRYSIGSNICKKIAIGIFRQLVQKGDFVYVLDFVENTLNKFTKKFELDNTYELDAANYCGLAYDETLNVFVLVNAGLDTISVHDGDNFKLLDSVHYSGRDHGVTSQHHVNDVCVLNGKAYVTYFSHSGNWKKGVFDGGVSEFDLNELHTSPQVLVTDLWKPHSPEIIDGNLCFLDSMRGRLYLKTQEFAVEYKSFARGLAFDGKYYYVGASEDMYMSERFGYTDSVLLNAGFYLYDPITHASRFYPMLDNMNIHDILILNG